MQMTLKSADLVEISGDSESALIAFPGLAKVETETGLIVGAEVPGAQVVSSPGEYEFGGISLVALESKPAHVGMAELFEIGLENTSTLFVVGSAGEITKEMWDVMGEIDVLVLNLGTEAEDIDKLIKKVSPYVVVVIGGSKETAEKSTGLTAEESAKKFKFSDKDFTAEDPVTRLVVLEK